MRLSMNATLACNLPQPADLLLALDVAQVHDQVADLRTVFGTAELIGQQVSGGRVDVDGGS